MRKVLSGMTNEFPLKIIYEMSITALTTANEITSDKKKMVIIDKALLQLVFNTVDNTGAALYINIYENKLIKRFFNSSTFRQWPLRQCIMLELGNYVMKKKKYCIV